MQKLSLTFLNPPARHYPIVIGHEILNDAQVWQECLPQKQVCIVSHASIAEWYLPALKDALSDKTILPVLIPEGEENKTLATWSMIVDALVAARFNRDAVIVALGGGVVGDIAGFAAASYQRGIGLVQVPTTLLAQVDSSVGGKTGVNHPAGKNLIGAFHQPQAVVIDTKTLHTLPAREFAAGMGEVVKYGLINDYAFFCWLEDNKAAIAARQHAALVEMIAHCCANKAAVVQADEREGGQRALLNLGHTFGHALEAVTHYQRWKHGEGVAIGVMCALRLSQQLGRIRAEDFQRAADLLQYFDLPIDIPTDISAETIYNAMQLDKKVQAGKLRLVLQRAFCDSVIEANCDAKTVLAAIEQCRNV